MKTTMFTLIAVLMGAMVALSPSQPAQASPIFSANLATHIDVGEIDEWGAIILADVKVRGYTRKDGTYVRPHRRTAPNSTKSDNYGCINNGRC